MFTFYFITVIVLSEAWMETKKKHTQTHKGKASAPPLEQNKHIKIENEMAIHNVELR